MVDPNDELCTDFTMRDYIECNHRALLAVSKLPRDTPESRIVRASRFFSVYNALCTERQERKRAIRLIQQV